MRATSVIYNDVLDNFSIVIFCIGKVRTKSRNNVPYGIQALYLDLLYFSEKTRIILKGTVSVSERLTIRTDYHHHFNKRTFFVQAERTSLHVVIIVLLYMYISPI